MAVPYIQVRDVIRVCEVACRAYELSFVGSLLKPDLALFEFSPCRF